MAPALRSIKCKKSQIPFPKPFFFSSFPDEILLFSLNNLICETASHFINAQSGLIHGNRYHLYAEDSQISN